MQHCLSQTLWHLQYNEHQNRSRILPCPFNLKNHVVFSNSVQLRYRTLSILKAVLLVEKGSPLSLIRYPYLTHLIGDEGESFRLICHLISCDEDTLNTIQRWRNEVRSPFGEPQSSYPSRNSQELLPKLFQYPRTTLGVLPPPFLAGDL